MERKLTVNVHVDGIDEATAKAKLLGEAIQRVIDLASELQAALNGLSVNANV